jgi:hypothetical protein
MTFEAVPTDGMFCYQNTNNVQVSNFGIRMYAFHIH